MGHLHRDATSTAVAAAAVGGDGGGEALCARNNEKFTYSIESRRITESPLKTIPSSTINSKTERDGIIFEQQLREVTKELSRWPC